MRSRFGAGTELSPSYGIKKERRGELTQGGHLERAPRPRGKGGEVGSGTSLQYQVPHGPQGAGGEYSLRISPASEGGKNYI
jgi:hypothetical protein